MRIDAVTIFPDYLDALDLSLIGRARRDGIIDLRVHDLRDFTHDRHRTVDDTPYGGGAGMVMQAQPWREALDHVLDDADGSSGPAPVLLVPGPGGERFTQAMARELAERPWLAFACGRYEGIDERVHEWAAERMEVRVVSLGDYVLNGGEVAVLAMVEAIGRLLPGVVGNAQSLVEESHEGGLLEHPAYTKPAVWDAGDGVERSVPEVLLGGDHAAIADWRHRQRLARTAARRPDLLVTAAAVTDLGHVDVRPAESSDAADLQVLTRACWAPEFARYGMFGAGEETLADVTAALGLWRTWVFHSEGRVVASVRARRAPDDPSVWQIGRLMVAPYLQGRGLGRAVLDHAERLAPEGIGTLWVNTGARSTRNLRLYKKAGYRVQPGVGAHPGTVDLTRPA